ncbi:MAG: HlyD family efflux transporter periplasmic adaptor subunit [Rudaea sp.]
MQRLPVILAILALAACGKPPATAPAGGGAATQAFVAIARGKVDVEGGLIHVAATRDGVVSEVRGNVGDDVKAGDILVVLDPKSAQIALDAVRAEIIAANAQVALLRSKSPALRVRASRIAEALRAGASSGQSADDARQALAELNAEIAVAEAGVATTRQKLRQAEYEVEARTLRAPLAARIVARTTHLGDVVSAQSAGDLVELLPEKPRIVRAELNEGFVAKVQVGMEAEITSDASPGKTWRGRVTRIGDVFGPSRLTESTQEPTDTRDVECILQLDSNELRVGQRVQARFLSVAR